MQLHFAQPLWLVVGLAASFATLLFLRSAARRRQLALQRFAAPRLLARLTANVSRPRRRVKNMLIILTVACVFIALARPQYGFRWVEVRRKGIDILIAVDTSRSMLARDVRPDRLERAKLAIRDFVSRLDGDRVGLLPFAGSAFLMCPLTTDYEAFDTSLDSLDTNIIPRGGTDIAGAIRAAGQVLLNEANHRILILVTDGENLQGDALAAAREAKKKKMTIYTVGVGTPAGELIPLADGQQGYLQDSSGRFVTSRLDEKMLTRIAEATGGLYVPLGNMGQGFDTIYRRKLALVPKAEHGEQMRKVPVERFAWPVAVALLLLAAEFLLPARKPSWRLRLPLVRTAGRRLRRQRHGALLLLAVLLLLYPAAGQASRGEEEYRAGRYDKAAAFYDRALEKNREDPVLLFNRGDVAYREKNYREAVTFFNRALASHDLDLQAKAYYNRGNAQYRLGETTLKTDPRQTMTLWQKALDSYEDSLQLKSDDADARHNLELVRKRLAKLRQQEERKKKEQQQDNSSGTDGGQQQDTGNSRKSNDKGGGQQKQDNGRRQSPERPGRAGNRTTPENTRSGGGEGQQQPDTGKTPQSARQRHQATEKKKGATPGGTGLPQEKQATPTTEKGATAAVRKMSEQDRKRRTEGRMTREEAIYLLDALKDDEATLNLVPGAGTGRDDEPERNW